MQEAGAGQFETCLKYREALRIADDTFYARKFITHIEREAGRACTFMAKPFASEPGSGIHLHINLTNKDGKNMFAGDEFVISKSNNITGSNIFKHFIAGLC